MDNSVLFQKIKVGRQTLSSRFVMPAMNAHATDNNAFKERGIAYFAEHAKGGFGLIVTEFVAVDPWGMGSLKECAAWSDDCIKDFRKLADAIHQYDAKIVAQMHHAGFVSKSNDPDFVAKAPSHLVLPNGKEFDGYTLEEVHQIRDRFISACERMYKAGMDGVEIHGAHGYLLTQFQSKKYNKRIDEYGGTLENRFRLTREIIEGARKVCGDDFIIGYRINGKDGDGPNDITLTEAASYCRMAEEAGADYISVSHHAIISPYFEDPGFNLGAAEEIKKYVSVPVIGVGRINDEHLAEDAILSGKCDLVALGRQSICDPHFPEKVRNGESKYIFRCLGCHQRCSPDVGCEEDDVGSSCMINPFTHKELRWTLDATDTPKKVAVIGAGCAGLQSAWVLAARGHKVDLYEKKDHIGGNLTAAAYPPKKYGFLQVINTEKNLCEKYGVMFHLNTKVDEKMLKESGAEVVIDCTGSVPITLNVKGIDRYCNAEDVLTGKHTVKGKKVAVIGGGTVGVETAEFLDANGITSDVIEMTSEIAADMVSPVRNRLLKNLNGKVGFCTDCKVVEIRDDNSVVVENNGQTKVLEGYDDVIIAAGYRSAKELDLNGLNAECYVIGDAAKARNAKMAIYEATKLAVRL